MHVYFVYTYMCIIISNVSKLHLYRLYIGIQCQSMTYIHAHVYVYIYSTHISCIYMSYNCSTQCPHIFAVNRVH